MKKAPVVRGSQAGGSAPRAATTRRTGPAADHAQAARTRSNSAGHKDSDSETLPASKAAAVSDSEAASAVETASVRGTLTPVNIWTRNHS